MALSWKTAEGQTNRTTKSNSLTNYIVLFSTANAENFFRVTMITMVIIIHGKLRPSPCLSPRTATASATLASTQSLRRSFTRWRSAGSSQRVALNRMPCSMQWSERNRITLPSVSQGLTAYNSTGASRLLSNCERTDTRLTWVCINAICECASERKKKTHNETLKWKRKQSRKIK